MYEVSYKYLARAIFAIPRARAILLGIEEVENSEEDSTESQSRNVPASEEDSEAVKKEGVKT